MPKAWAAAASAGADITSKLDRFEMVARSAGPRRSSLPRLAEVVWADRIEPRRLG